LFIAPEHTHSNLLGLILSGVRKLPSGDPTFPRRHHGAAEGAYGVMWRTYLVVPGPARATKASLPQIGFHALFGPIKGTFEIFWD
jgi:hypothetical protein